MRKLLGTLTLGLLVFGLVGLFRGWFSLSTNSGSEQTKIELKIDKERLKQDTERLKNGVSNLSDKIQSVSGSDASDPNSPVLPPTTEGSGDLVLPPN